MEISKRYLSIKVLCLYDSKVKHLFTLREALKVVLILSFLIPQKEGKLNEQYIVCHFFEDT